MRSALSLLLLASCAGGPPLVTAPMAAASPAVPRGAAAGGPACGPDHPRVRAVPEGDLLRLEACEQSPCPTVWARAWTLVSSMEDQPETLVLTGGSFGEGGFSADCGNYGECVMGVAVRCDPEHVRIVLPLDYRWTLEPEPDPTPDRGWVFLEHHRPGAASEEASSPVPTSHTRWVWMGGAYVPFGSP